jgi:HD-GYP domain-containing protein (c-di-GMP phosphodiesterase class II)
MAKKRLSQLQPGDQLKEDVITPLGGVLFHKNRSIVTKDFEILKAFKVESVNIISVDDTDEEDKKEKDEKQREEFKKNTTFEKLYDNMISVLKQVFAAVNAGVPLPMMDMRQTLEALIQNIHHYQVLSFSVKNIKSEDYLYHSSTKIALTAYQLAKWYGLDSKDLIQVAISGLFHDIGNIKIDSDILLKPTRLTAEELEAMKKHTIIGYNMIKNAAGINEGVKMSALQHHEKEDGSGYPLGVTGDKIHIYAKIVAVADIYHAMTSKREYKEARSPYLVLEQLFNESFGKLDPKLVQIFINKVTQFHNGTMVKLSDGSIGEIVFSDREHPTRPWVSVDGKIINLTLQRSLFIEAVIPG